jgi:hypothetical protein
LLGADGKTTANVFLKLRTWVVECLLLSDIGGDPVNPDRGM